MDANISFISLSYDEILFMVEWISKEISYTYIHALVLASSSDKYIKKKCAS